MKKCISCNNSVTNNYVAFKCPSCLKETIIRCERCRHDSKKYKCPKCAFIGP